jgi:hypothetical protein
MAMNKRLATALSVSILAFFQTGCVSINVKDINTQLDTLPPAWALLGTWDVEMQYDANLAPSKTEMKITRVEGGALEGSFYGTSLEAGRFVARGSTWVFGGRTADQSGPYWHSGRLRGDGSIEGQTLSEGRKFIMTWRAVRK